MTNLKFNCEKYLNKCKAKCCCSAPLERDLYEKHKDKALKPYTELDYKGIDPETGEEVDLVIMTTEDGSCCFLDESLKCIIHDDKPIVCQKFGNESHPMLVCPYQDKDGRERSRQERRQRERSLHGTIKKINR